MNYENNMRKQIKELRFFIKNCARTVPQCHGHVSTASTQKNHTNKSAES